MGYRSTVVLAVTEAADAKGKLNPLIANLLDSNCVKKDIREDGIFYEINEIKWYDSYPHIDAVNKWMDEMEKEAIDEDVPYQFVRAGEGNNDTEERGNVEFGIYASTMIGY
jgi:hypothetical protein